MTNQGKPVERAVETVAEVASPPPATNPPCLCRHSLGAHAKGGQCVFCGCLQFRVETPAEAATPGRPESPVDLVARQPAFRNVAREHLLEMMRAGRKREFLQRMVLLREGETSGCIYVLLSGSVRVECDLDSGVPRHLADLGPGEIIGEMGTLQGLPRSATVTAVEDVQALELTLDELREVFQHDSDLVLGFARLIRSRKPAGLT